MSKRADTIRRQKRLQRHQKEAQARQEAGERAAQFIAGCAQARCRHCDTPLDFVSKHAEGCPYPAEQARMMQNYMPSLDYLQSAANAYDQRIADLFTKSQTSS